MQVSMQIHRDRVGITMGLFTKFYFSFVTLLWMV